SMPSARALGVYSMRDGFDRGMGLVGGSLQLSSPPLPLLAARSFCTGGDGAADRREGTASPVADGAASLPSSTSVASGRFAELGGGSGERVGEAGVRAGAFSRRAGACGGSGAGAVATRARGGVSTVTSTGDGARFPVAGGRARAARTNSAAWKTIE